MEEPWRQTSSRFALKFQSIFQVLQRFLSLLLGSISPRSWDAAPGSASPCCCPGLHFHTSEDVPVLKGWNAVTAVSLSAALVLMHSPFI